MPVILGPDGPSLGGFVCPATIVQAELWKMGQLKPGDLFASARFREARRGDWKSRWRSCDRRPLAVRHPRCLRRSRAIEAGAAQRVTGVVVPRGWRPVSADRVRAQRARSESAVARACAGRAAARGDLPGILDITPGVRSLQVHYDARVLSARPSAGGAGRLRGADSGSRQLRRALAHRAFAAVLGRSGDATGHRKYMQSVRPDAPWCPSNIEFIRRINGLAFDR